MPRLGQQRWLRIMGNTLVHLEEGGRRRDPPPFGGSRGCGGGEASSPPHPLSQKLIFVCGWYFLWDFSKKLKNATCPAFGGGFAPKDDAGADTSSSVHTLFRQWICIETKTLQRDIFITVSLYHCFGTQSCVVSQTIHWIGSRF